MSEQNVCLVKEKIMKILFILFSILPSLGIFFSPLKCGLQYNGLKRPKIIKSINTGIHTRK